MTRLLRCLPVLLLVCAGVVAAAPSATAGVLDVTCAPPSSNLNSYDPPMTNAPQVVSVSTTALYGPCVSLSQPAITSGSRTAGFTTTASCLDLLEPGTITYTVTWNTGQSSTITSNYTAAAAGAVLTIVATGVVTSGLFAGDAVVTNFTGPAADVTLCTLGLGTVSDIYTVGALEITSV